MGTSDGTQKGVRLVLGVVEPMPLADFPRGWVRIRMRARRPVEVFIRPFEGGIRKFLIREEDGKWLPAIAVGANVRYWPVPEYADLVVDEAGEVSIVICHKLSEKMEAELLDSAGEN